MELARNTTTACHEYSKWVQAGVGDADVYIFLKQEKTMSDSKSETGKTIGLIDALITILSVLSERELSEPEIQEALKDLKPKAEKFLRGVKG